MAMPGRVPARRPGAGAGAAGVFEGAPLACALWWATAAASVLGGSDLRSNRGAGTTKGWHGVALSLVQLATGGEIFLGLWLLLVFRTLERVRGSRKVAVQAGWTALVYAGACEALRRHAGALPASLPRALRRHGPFPGSYATIFSLLVSYARDIPSTDSYTALGVTLSNKTLFYAIALHLLTNNGARALAAGCLGLAAGLIYNATPLRRLEVPSVLAGAFWRSGGWLLEPRASAGPKVRLGRMVTAGGGGGAFVTRDAVGGGNHLGAGVVPEPDAAALEQLVSMGFDPHTSAEALRAANNDVNQAMNILLR